MAASMEEPQAPPAIRIFVDADACPVKPEIYRVAERYGLKVYVVANAFMAVPRSELIERVIVAEGPDAADDWIAERATEFDIVVTADIPLAGRCVRKRRHGDRTDRQAVQRGLRSAWRWPPATCSPSCARPARPRAGRRR